MKKYVLPVFLTATLAGCGGGMSKTSTTTTPGQPSTRSQVTGSSPANNSTVPPQVHFVANAATPCTKGVSLMSVYTASNTLAYTTKGSTLDTQLNLNPGKYSTSVQAVDNCGGTASTPVNITVSSTAGTPPNPAPPPTPGKIFASLQTSKGWNGYGLLPTSYTICSSCKSSGPQVTWSMKQGVTSPSLSGKATQFDIGGTMQFADALWNNHLIGDYSSQGLADGGHSLAPTLHNFIYDVYFYSDKMETSQAVEFDINQFVNGKSFIWGHECRIAGGHQWDIWDNQGMKWIPTGIACNPKTNSWNHLTIQVQRTSDDQVLFHTITLNGKTSTLNHKEPPTSTGWYGVTINYQMDGNHSQQPYSVWLDNLNFNYW